MAYFLFPLMKNTLLFLLMKMIVSIYLERWLERIIRMRLEISCNKRVRILGQYFLYPWYYKICMKVGVYYGGR